MSVPIPGAREPQQRAVDAIEACLAGGDRVQLRMACGVGKTLIGQYVAERLGSSRTAVVVPSLDLVAQTLRAWLPRLEAGTALLVVCSDPSAGLSVQERQDAEVGETLVTTDPGRAGHFLQSNERVLVVSTYKSLLALAKAAREGTGLDLLVLDEAHHLTGRLDRRHRPALHNDVLPARHRLFMTATPVVLQDRPEAPEGFDPFDVEGASKAPSDLVSMDDRALFGPVAFTYTVREAIQDGFLADYRVLVVARADTTFNSARLPMLALSAAAAQYGVRRALSFHNRVADAVGFTRLLSTHGSKQVRFVADFVHGETPTSTRREVLQRLGGATGDKVVRVVSAARCLREGVDVCAVDAVMFAAPRSSTVDIVQAIGRALRTYPGKTSGTIVIPVLLPAGTDDDEDLTKTAFAHVWKVLRGLNAHDPRVAQEMDLIRTTASTGHHTAHVRAGHHDIPLPAWFEVVGAGVDLNRVKARLVTAAAPRWDKTLDLVAAAADHHGGSYRLTLTSTWEGISIGSWIQSQRLLYRQGVLSPARVHQLHTHVTGWAWDLEEIQDLRMLDHLSTHTSEHGSSRDATSGDSLYAKVPGMPRTGRWLSRFRRAYRADELDERRITKARALPGWTAEPLDTHERAGVEAYTSFVTWEKHGDVPVGHVEDGFDLADWLDQVRCAHLAGTLSPELVDEILAVAPVNKHAEPVFNYESARIRTRLALTALSAWIAGGQNASAVPVDHCEVMCGVTVQLYQWCARQRWLYNRGDLDPELAAILEALPGWVWSLREARHIAGAPIRLPKGAKHGTPSGGSHYRCPCGPCQEAQRAFQAKWKRDQNHRLSRFYQPCPDGARHVVGLLASAPQTPAISAAAAIGMPSSLLRKVLADPGTPVPPRFGPIMENLTLVDLQWWTTPGTRGRTSSRASESGDSRQVDAWLTQLLAAGWTRAMLGAELGYAGAIKGVIAGPGVTLAAEHVLGRLMEHLGSDLDPPAYLQDAQARGASPRLRQAS